MSYLEKFTGDWNSARARHLLRRTMFGPSEEDVESAVLLGLDGTLDRLFDEDSIPDPPVKYHPDGSGSNALDDPGAKQGETWINADPFPNVNPPMLRNRVIRARSKSLYAWTILQMHYAGMSIREKLILFWHNHFVTTSIVPHREYFYHMLLRSHSLGNFRQLTKEITIDTSMLLYLSGAENTNAAPNENYSRELLELFTVGKGPLIGPGDYTNYTEQDVVEMAKVLSGWRVPRISDPDTLTASFDGRLHTPGDKQLSKHFGDVIIHENGEDEYEDLIDVIFQQDECSRFIIRKFYRWFVNSNLTPEVEQNVIEPLAQQMRADDYDIAPTLRTLLSSEHFFQSTACMIKSPIDLLFSASRAFGAEPPKSGVEEEYGYAYDLYGMTAELDQAMFDHPDVAGWKAYYQEPGLDRNWLNNLLLPKRHELCRAIVEGGTITIDGENYRIAPMVPVLELAASIPNAVNISDLVTGLAERIFNYSISSTQLMALKDIVLQGLPDFEWADEYGAHLADPGNDALRVPVENKLRGLLSAMMSMSEFQVM
jgi:hypothetical protein